HGDSGRIRTAEDVPRKQTLRLMQLERRPWRFKLVAQLAKPFDSGDDLNGCQPQSERARRRKVNWKSSIASPQNGGERAPNEHRVRCRLGVSGKNRHREGESGKHDTSSRRVGAKTNNGVADQRQPYCRVAERLSLP